MGGTLYYSSHNPHEELRCRRHLAGFTRVFHPASTSFCPSSKSPDANLRELRGRV